MKEPTYYGTTAWCPPCEEFIVKYGKSTHNQYRFVCKAKSMAEANRIAESIGLSNGRKFFEGNYTDDTGNLVEIEACDKFGIAVQTSGAIGHGDYVDAREIVKKR